jgi:hypothetical protein
MTIEFLENSYRVRAVYGKSPPDIDDTQILVEPHPDLIVVDLDRHPHAWRVIGRLLYVRTAEV